MQLPAPARECTDAELQTVWDHYTRRQPQPLEPMRFEPRRYEEWQAAHAAMDWDDDGPAQDLTSMGMLVMAGCTAVGVVGLIALAVALWPK